MKAAGKQVRAKLAFTMPSGSRLDEVKATGKQVRVAPKLKPIKQRVTINVTLSATPLLVSLTQGDNSFLNGKLKTGVT